ncbi:pyrimidine 5'-nucleotidase [Pararhodobacter aggregans]|uniref:Pyrimidine 5'-nucleotidase n=1 Tax=Pararhodobacter aggregans TaxID=404875 RepID=A0A2T7UWZ6_9RHOB|nr:pyrimidine 5'-nucleotidase [Pararhodobacter aggregans]PTX04757.1 putative hydrolase of the HAD superfamily [Pararhodobacter aggregans]PVE49089.1 pyrimidine 5'-nucleotidase [Pararhodobacter aggregans]
MAHEHFQHVDTWVFDLDNTLYHPRVRLFDQIDVKMTDFVMRVTGADRAESDRLRRDYWLTYGTTLAGLMAHHAVDPVPYLVEVHDIDFSVLEPDPELRDAILALKGRRIVYTNGSAPYARRVLEARGLEGLFEAVYGVEDAGYRPKPQAEAFETVFGLAGLDPSRAAMFEDDLRNLKVPHALGMRTVLVGPEAETPDPEAHAHVHHRTDDLAGFLRGL